MREQNPRSRMTKLAETLKWSDYKISIYDKAIKFKTKELKF